MHLPLKQMLPVCLGWLLTVFSGNAAATVPACTSVVRFELAPKAPLAVGLQGKLALRPVEGEKETLNLEARIGAPVTAELPCASKWEVTPNFPEVWGPRLTVNAGASGTTVVSSIALWPLGRIAGSVKILEKEERHPKVLSVATLLPRTPTQRDLPKGVLDCPVDAQGKWQCPPLPATTFNLVLSAAGFIPQYRWGAQVLWWRVEVASSEPKFETRTKVKVESDGQDQVRADSASLGFSGNTISRFPPSSLNWWNSEARPFAALKRSGRVPS